MILGSPFFMMGHNPGYLVMVGFVLKTLHEYSLIDSTNSVMILQLNGIGLVPNHFHSIFASCVPLSPM